MKTTLATIAIVLALAAGAIAETCYTNCYTLGDTQYCTTTCSAY